MSMNLNSVTVCGRLTRDPELRALPSGTQVASFSLAVNRVYTKDGQKEEQVEYVNVTVFSRLAEVCSQYLRKGDTALVQGRLQTRSWDKNGEKQHRTEVVAELVQFGPGGTRTDVPSVQYGSSTAAPTTKVEQQTSTAPVAASGIQYPDEVVDPDDIPF